MTATACHPATIVTRNGRRWWRCACGRTLGEVHDDRVIIKAGDRWLVLLLTAPITQRCPNPACGAWSTIGEDVAA